MVMIIMMFNMCCYYCILCLLCVSVFGSRSSRLWSSGLQGLGSSKLELRFREFLEGMAMVSRTLRLLLVSFPLAASFEVAQPPGHYRALGLGFSASLGVDLGCMAWLGVLAFFIRATSVKLTPYAILTHPITLSIRGDNPL